jgi:hypothetical protein
MVGPYCPSSGKDAASAERYSLTIAGLARHYLVEGRRGKVPGSIAGAIN